MPANTSAIVMRAAPGRELSCKTRSYRFQENGSTVDQGVISFFAARALVHSRTMKDWLDATTAALTAYPNLPRLARADLQLLGAQHTLLP